MDHRLKTGSHAADKESYEVSTSSVNAPAGSRIQAGGRALNGHGQKRIRDIVREICGIGLGNQWTPPGMFTACMAIAACTYTTYSSPDTYYEPGSFGLFGIIISVGLTRKKKKIKTPAVGSYFGARQDQSAMLGILERTQKQHARPTEHVIQKMIGLWGWTPSSASPAMPSAG